MLKAIIFDLDQTIVNSLKKFFITFNKTLNEFGGKEISWDIFKEHYISDSLNSLIPKNILIESFWDLFLRKYDENEVTSLPIEGAKETLKYLKRNLGVKIIVVTGRKSSSQKVTNELKRIGLLEYIDYIKTASNIKEIAKDFSKEKLLIDVLKKFNLKSSECIFVGDYKPDMKSGKKLKVLTVGVLTGYETEKSLKNAGADYVIESIKYLPLLINKVCKK